MSWKGDCFPKKVITTSSYWLVDPNSSRVKRFIENTNNQN